MVARLILHSSKQQGVYSTMTTTEDKFKLIFLYETGYIFGQTTCQYLHVQDSYLYVRKHYFLIYFPYSVDWN